MTQPTPCRAWLDLQLQSSDPSDWLAWLPLLEIATQQPAVWLAEFQTLALEQQFELIECLRHAEAGPLADNLLLHLAQQAEAIDDVQLRAYLLEDALAVRVHQQQRLSALSSSALEERAQANLDLALRLQEKEQAWAKVRHQEHEQDQNYHRLHALERDLSRWQIRQRLLEKEDLAARQQEVDHLRSTIEAQTAPRAALMTQWRTLQTEQQDLQTQQTTQQQQISALQEEVPRQQEALQRDQDSLNQLRQEKQQQQQQLAALRTTLEAEREQLQAIEQSQKTTELQTVIEKIREVYALLPDDLADQAAKGNPSR